MSMIKVSGLTFGYEGNPDLIFDDVSFTIDTDWKLGLIGRNGKGKTTFLNLLMGKYPYSGTITSDARFDYFPFEAPDRDEDSFSMAERYVDGFQEWKLVREVSLLDMDSSVLYMPFGTLSQGERTKVMLAVMFLKENNFLLIDEPTNHLDMRAREAVSRYLGTKKGFIVVSHDRSFLDSCVDHILSIERTKITVQRGNFSSWWENKNRTDAFEASENSRLEKEISRLEKSAEQTSTWASRVESSKYHRSSDSSQDRGYIGRKSAKMMKRSISARNRREADIQKKSALLKNIEKNEPLKMHLIPNRSGPIIEAHGLSITYGSRRIFEGVDFRLSEGDRLLLSGRNGCGKSSIIKLIEGAGIEHSGQISVRSGIVISSLPQDTSFLEGSLKEFAEASGIDRTLFMTILRKLDFKRDMFEKDMGSYSEGQKKKVLLAKSLSETANVFIWDEPLNYIDLFSRIQIEELLLDQKPTMIFVEHDRSFAEKIATKTVEIKAPGD
ncbi:MAG: ribosomal protection-like ABC-F family protein [Oscillospiraceae bacterium]|jgi:lincosamide and streptogramin A transport system ATP-binding/permease protein